MADVRDTMAVVRDDDDDDEHDWSDVELPEAVVDARPLAHIAYSPTYAKLMRCFWHAAARNEYSPRVYDLTTRIIDICEGHYTVWKYRRDTIRQLGLDPRTELAFIRQYTVERPKNYQLWRQREVILEMLGAAIGSDRAARAELLRGERDDLQLAFLDEPKNYHAWQYRHWLMLHLDLPLDTELAFTTEMIRRDPYNNSAWNYRHGIRRRGAERQGITTTTMVFTEEADLIQSLARQHPLHNNQAVLSYLHSLSGTCPGLAHLLETCGLTEAYRRLYPAEQ